MGRLDITGFGDLESLLKGLSEPEKIAKKAVKAAAPVIEKNLKSEIKRAANRKDKRGKPYSTGGLAGSIKSTPVLENDLGVYAVVKPEGNNTRGLPYAQEMAFLEYGVASHGQEPRPVRRNAVAASEAECLRIMEQVVNEEVDKL